jgi:hypothetical protein
LSSPERADFRAEWPEIDRRIVRSAGDEIPGLNGRPGSAVGLECGRPRHALAGLSSYLAWTRLGDLAIAKGVADREPDPRVDHLVVAMDLNLRLFMRGASFGFYQYRNEPWHWEYNPEGFRQTFWAGMPDLQPALEVEQATTSRKKKTRA